MELLAQHLTNNAINFSTSASQLVAFAHAALYSPDLSTLQRALDKNFLPPFPGLTAQTLRKHPPTYDATVKGYLDNTRKNLRSTKTPAKDPLQDLLDDYFPDQPSDTTRTNLCHVA